MKKITLLKLFLFAFWLGSAQQNCINSITVTAGIHNNLQIQGTPPAIFCVGPAANAANWFKYVPTQTYTVTVTTDLPQNANKDSRLQVYEGSCTNLVCVGGDDDSGSGYLSVFEFTAVVGNSYWFVFDNYWGSNNADNLDFQIIESDFVAPELPAVSFTTVSRPIGGSFRLGVVDMNGDYLDDIVSIGGSSVEIHKQQTDGTFQVQNTVTASVSQGSLPTWSLSAADYDDNGFTDLLYGGGTGVTFMKANSTGTAFEKSNFTQYVFSQRSNFVDINNDGHLDAFMCHDVAPNVYYMNDGLGNLTFNQGGLGVYPTGGNYGSIWVDYDNDGDQDLFIAKCRGGQTNGANVNEMHRNNGNGTFTEVGELVNLKDPIQTWSSAWGDFDNDGFMDVMVGASSNANGTHKLMRNNGSGAFVNITASSGVDTFTGLGIEYVAQDFNNDGFIDIFCGESSVILINNGNLTFTQVPVTANAGAIGDLNNDGFLDILNGTNIRFNVPNTNHWIKFNLQGVQSNRNGIGARIEIYGTWGKQIRDVRSGDGFRFMSSLNPHFGIGQSTEITQVIIRWPSGIVDTFNNVAIDQSLFVMEGITLNTNENNYAQFKLYPNPTDDYIKVETIETQEFVSYQIFDIHGRVVKSSVWKQSTIIVSDLNSGTYFLQLIDTKGKLQSQKFIKK